MIRIQKLGKREIGDFQHRLKLVLYWNITFENKIELVSYWLSAFNNPHCIHGQWETTNSHIKITKRGKLYMALTPSYDHSMNRGKVMLKLNSLNMFKWVFAYNVSGR